MIAGSRYTMGIAGFTRQEENYYLEQLRHSPQCWQSCDKLFATHPEQCVPLDELVEIHRIEIPPLRVREPRNIPRLDCLPDPLRKITTISRRPSVSALMRNLSQPLKTFARQ